jgi:N-acetylglucosamine-6-phosphate deacetylase
LGNLKAYSADRIFTGEYWLDDHVVISEKGVIREIVTSGSINPGIELETFPGCFIAPSFIDLQIYGAFGRLLAVYPDAQSLFRLSDYCRQGGASFCLPTVATNTIEVFYQCIDAVKDYWNKGGESVLGLHIEGPWINNLRRGAHIEEMIHAPSLEEVKDLLDYGRGVIRIITLAPEICSKEVISFIRARDIIISAGHSNATYKEGTEAFDEGITAATHLFNAMSPLQHRQPGLVGAIMDHRSAVVSIIPDGYHVDWAAIRIAKQVLKERIFVITDAVTETSSGAYPHQLAGDKYESSGILSGSALTMAKAARNLVTHTNVELGEALRMCSLYPARVIGLQDKAGRIEPGFSTNMVVLDKEMNVRNTIYQTLPT